MTIYVIDQRQRAKAAPPTKYLYPAAKPQRTNWWENFGPEHRLLTGRSYHLAKRSFDITVVLLALPLLLPVIVLCALLVKLESANAPVFFTQQRTGKDGHRFGMFKFRTMVANAEALKKDLSHLNELQWPDFKITDDPRVTRIGRFLRKSSLDELPQIFNVLRGDMSIVGPRPTSFQPETYRLWQTARLDVLPGLTGLWQIIGRGSMEFDERVALDIAYIKRQSFALDLMILIRTVGTVLRREGAV